MIFIPKFPFSIVKTVAFTLRLALERLIGLYYWRFIAEHISSNGTFFHSMMRVVSKFQMLPYKHSK